MKTCFRGRNIWKNVMQKLFQRKALNMWVYCTCCRFVLRLNQYSMSFKCLPSIQSTNCRQANPNPSTKLTITPSTKLHVHVHLASVVMVSFVLDLATCRVSFLLGLELPDLDWILGTYLTWIDFQSYLRPNFTCNMHTYMYM